MVLCGEKVVIRVEVRIRSCGPEQPGRKTRKR